jgi:hypothetical protein
VDTDIGITRGGPKAPVAATPARAARSVRRTTTIDSARPDGPAGDVLVTARARDLHTPDAGSARVLGAAGFTAAITAGRVLREIHHPDRRLAALAGVPVASRFRARVLELVPEEAARLSLLNLLLDDLPGANLVAGFALQRDPAWSSGPVPAEHLAVLTDLCAGWADDATIVGAVRSAGAVPVPAIAPVASDGDDRDAWHERPALPAGAMRRSRRLDVVDDDPGGGTLGFHVHFRDSYRAAAEGEGAVHEYTVRGRFDPATRILLALDAAAHVLPWTECPQALGSARRVVGTSTDDIRARVRSDFTGTTTCTHLNDVLRSLADLPALAAPLRGERTSSP